MFLLPRSVMGFAKLGTTFIFIVPHPSGFPIKTFPYFYQEVFVLSELVDVLVLLLHF